MEGIEHKFIGVNGLKLHIAEAGTGSSAVVFLHGFPEIWYTWRHQMIAVAKAGFRAIAPDYRGYGLSDPSAEPERTSFSDLTSDLLAVLDALAISKVCLVKSFGEPSNVKDPNDVPKVEAPALLIMGEKDYVFKFPGMEDYIRSGQVKMFVPNLEIIILPDGGHFVQEQFPDQVNQLILTFLNDNGKP